MNQAAREKVIELFGRDPGVGDNAKRCEALLHDLCRNERRKEILALCAAIRERVVSDLRAGAGSAPVEAHINTDAARRIFAEEKARTSSSPPVNALGMTFVRIPAGSFTMGSNSSESDDDEKPVHPVTITRLFELQTTAVTQAQWKALMRSNPSHFRGNDLPVKNVSWDGCQAFIRKLNKKDPGKGHRLPTEAEWEYACQAANQK